jgi:UDP-N-acetylmuramoyl-L-alanyl-D-glutamate--2,6-diaminopimelate ligase
VVAGAFTNLSRDHLDYHADGGLFRRQDAPVHEVVDGAAAVIWADDEWRQGHRACTRAGSIAHRGRAGRDDPPAAANRAAGAGDEVVHDGVERQVNLPLIGAYQAANALVRRGWRWPAGWAAQVFDALGRLQPVRGRLERAGLNRAGAPAYVDYAHTPDALEAAIAACARMRRAADRGVWRGRRPRCRQAPPDGPHRRHQADIAIVTDDNPRGEDPAAIRAAILAGCETGDIREIGDRRAAIAELCGWQAGAMCV